MMDQYEVVKLIDDSMIKLLGKIDDERYDRQTDVADIYEEIVALRDTINRLATQVAEKWEQ